MQLYLGIISILEIRRVKGGPNVKGTTEAIEETIDRYRTGTL